MKLLWLFIFVVPLFAQENSIENKIMKYCEDKWGTNNPIIENEYNKQIEAFKEIEKVLNKSKATNNEREIGNMIKRASFKYWLIKYDIPDFYKVVEECNKQMDAVIKISNFYSKYGPGKVEYSMLNNSIGKYYDPIFDTYDYIGIVDEFNKQLKEYNNIKK